MEARVYLQKGDYTNAAQAAKPRYHHGHSKWPFFEKALYRMRFLIMYPANTTEDISLWQVTTSSGNNSFQTFFSALSRGIFKLILSYCAL